MTKARQYGWGEAGGPLYSEPAQSAVLGSCLLKNDLLRGPASSLSADDFVGTDHQAIFRAMRQLSNDGLPFNAGVIAEELSRDGHTRWYAIVSDLLNGVVADPGIVQRHVDTLHRFASSRHLHAFASRLAHDAEAGINPAELSARMAQFASEAPRLGNGAIHKFDQIPDILTMEIPAIDYVVDGLISRNTITLWTGIDGTAKTFLAQRMAVDVATGETFLGRRCFKASVLYLDYENPAFAVRERLEAMAGGPVDGLKVWGTWVEPQPPQIGFDVLLDFAKETKPLIVFDPFRYSHVAEENDSGEMMVVMRHLRSYASAGAAVVVLHHPSKTEGSTGRGSTAIRGAVDVAYQQEMDDDGRLITIRCLKNRFGHRFSVTIQPDYDAGTFKVADSPEFTKRQDEIETIARVIREHPGLSQNELTGFLSMTKARAIKLVKSHTGILWETKIGPRNSLLYYPVDRFPEVETSQKTREPVGQFSAPVSWFSPLKGETRKPVTAPETGWKETII